MAAAVVQFNYTETTSAVASATSTFGSSTATGNGFWVLIASFNSNPTFTVTDNKGNGNYAQCGGYVYPTVQVSIAIFYLPAGLGGASHTITVTPSSSHYITMVVVEVSGAPAVSPIDTTVSATGLSATPDSGSCAVGAAGELMLAVQATSNAIASAGAGFTVLHNSVTVSNEPIGTEYQAVSAVTAATFTLNTSAQWGIIAVTIKAAGAAPTYPGPAVQRKRHWNPSRLRWEYFAMKFRPFPMPVTVVVLRTPIRQIARTNTVRRNAGNALFSTVTNVTTTVLVSSPRKVR